MNSGQFNSVKKQRLLQNNADSHKFTDDNQRNTIDHSDSKGTKVYMHQKQPTIKKIQKVDLRQKHIKQNDSVTNLNPSGQNYHGPITQLVDEGNSINSLDRSQNPYFGNQNQQNISGYVETTQNDFRGVSNITSRKKSINGSDFKERFQGRQSLMNKEGHIGVVMNANQPIKKVDKVQISQNLLESTSKQSYLQDPRGGQNSMTPIANNHRNRNFTNNDGKAILSLQDDTKNSKSPAYGGRNLITPIQYDGQQGSPGSQQKNYNFTSDYDGQNRTPMGIEKRPRMYGDSTPMKHQDIRDRNRRNQGADFQRRFGSPETNLIESLNGTLMGNGNSGVLPNGADGKGHDLSNNKYNSGIKSAQRSSNFVRAGNSISSSVQKQNINLSRSGNNIKAQRFSVNAAQPQSQPNSMNKNNRDPINFNLNQASNQQPNTSNSNLPTQYSSSRFGNNNMNSRQGAIPINPMGAVSFTGTGQNGFAAQSNSSHYNRNHSPQQQLLSGNGMVQQPASGGYMGQGLGMIGFLEPTGSDANSTSFYSNNTSIAQQIPSNLNNSRYLLNRREKMGHLGVSTNQNSVSKVIPPVTKSIDGYGSHSSNFRNQAYQNYTSNQKETIQLIGGSAPNSQNQFQRSHQIQQQNMPHLKSSFYSSSANGNQQAPMGSSNYEKLQAKYGKGQNNQMSSSNYANKTPAIGSQGVNMGTSNNFQQQQQQNDGFPQLSPYRQRVKQRSIHKFDAKTIDHDGERIIPSGIYQKPNSKYQEMILKKQSIVANMA